MSAGAAHSLPTRNGNISVEEAAALYRTGDYSLDTLAGMAGTTRPTMRKRLVAAGAEIRGRGGGEPGEGREWQNVILHRAVEIVESYDTNVTVQQLHYRLISEGVGYRNEQNDYDYLCHCTARWRRASVLFLDTIKSELIHDSRPSVLLYAGDLDPSGFDIYRHFVEYTGFDDVEHVALDAAADPGESSTDEKVLRMSAFVPSDSGPGLPSFRFRSRSHA